MKEAKTDYPVHELLANRWSPLSFADEPVTDAELHSLLEAARWSASSFNEQPWSFLVARKADAEAHARMVACLVDGNQVWAKGAPLLMISVAKVRFARNDKPNRHAWHDVGAAAASLALQATAMDLYVHQMAGIHVDRTREAYGVPEGYEPVAALAVGRLGSVEALPENLASRETAPRTRKPQSDFVFFDAWPS